MNDYHQNYQKMLDAAKTGDIDTVNYWIATGMNDDDGALCLRMACNNGHVECVKALIPISGTNIFDTCLFLAVQGNHVECVRELLPYSDPKHNSNISVRMAMINNNQDIFDLLYPLIDPLKAIEDTKNNIISDRVAPTMIEQRLKAEQEKNILEHSVGQGHEKITRKM